MLLQPSVHTSAATRPAMHAPAILSLTGLSLFLSGCVVAQVAETAVDVAAIPVKAVSAGVDAATTSQAEADRAQGRALRREDERRGREFRLLLERCRLNRPLPGDVCPPAQPRN
jgi:isocitrate lyase